MRHDAGNRKHDKTSLFRASCFLPHASCPIFDCAIIGAGPAGLSAAMQASRQGLSAALFERAEAGGQMLAANLIENYPGITDGITGRALAKRFVRQACVHGVEIRHENVTRVSANASSFSVVTNRSKIKCRTVIVACGLAPNNLGCHIDKGLEGKNLFYYCGPSTLRCRGKRVIVVGNGDAAFDIALNFKGRGARVTVAMRGETPKCLPLLCKRARTAGIKVCVNKKVSIIEKRGALALVKFTDGDFIESHFVIVCAGKCRSFNFIDKHLLRGKKAGLYFAGDCARGLDRHIAIACGDGISAAMKAHQYVSSAVRRFVSNTL